MLSQDEKAKLRTKLREALLAVAVAQSGRTNTLRIAGISLIKEVQALHRLIDEELS